MINSFLQSYCISESLYLLDASGDYVYYLELVENVSAYSVQFNAYPVPTALPVGYTAPAGWPGYPAVASVPQLIVPDTNFQYIIGFTPATYPAATQATNYSHLSDFTPQVTPVSSCVLTCSLLNNRYSNPGTILYSFSPAGTTYGALIESEPTQYSFIDIQDGSYSYIEVSFIDQDFNPITLQDTNLIIVLLIRNNRLDY
jgi:hypothetical protein